MGNALLKINKEHPFSKVGVDEIEGLKEAMTEVMTPLKEAIQEKYWGRVELEESEYKRRDGFIPHFHNCGGLEIFEIVPKWEEYSFGFMEFGEMTDSDYSSPDLSEEEREEEEESMRNEGHLDAALKIWFKFEGLDENTNRMKFYLVLSGGNQDAPYFRDIPTLFEDEFTCKTLQDLKKSRSSEN